MDRKAELIEALEKLCHDEFRDDQRKMFDYYSDHLGDIPGQMDGDGLWKLLKDAGVGSFATRHAYVTAIFDALDRDHSGAVSWEEFQAATQT